MEGSRDNVPCEARCDVMPSTPYQLSALNMVFAQRWYIKQELEKNKVKFDCLGINYFYFKLFQMSINTMRLTGMQSVAEEVAKDQLEGHKFPGRAFINVENGNFATNSIFVLLIFFGVGKISRHNSMCI